MTTTPDEPISDPQVFPDPAPDGEPDADPLEDPSVPGEGRLPDDPREAPPEQQQV